MSKGCFLFSGYEFDMVSELELINTSSCCQVLEVSQDAQVAECIYKTVQCKTSVIIITVKCWYGVFFSILQEDACPGWLVATGACLYGSTHMGARYRCSLYGAARHQVRTAQTQPYVSDSVPTGGSDRCNKLTESCDGQKKNTRL